MYILQYLQKNYNKVVSVYQYNVLADQFLLPARKVSALNRLTRVLEWRENGLDAVVLRFDRFFLKR
ncbi:hypothetical protein [Candidatus Paracaedibacter symbiosus]|uniref:hypothetical protein n=1 Tax=Candidatus Paracaedibacter symbiosus TaxID=244582 RepID=UPI0018DEBB1A|nr:hypothetical protein [Candidatus Paracaedibacter symbiosus]